MIRQILKGQPGLFLRLGEHSLGGGCEAVENSGPEDRVAEYGTGGMVGEEYGCILYKDPAKPDQQSKKLLEGHVVGKGVVSSSGKECSLLPFDPWEDLCQKFSRGF